MSEHYLGIDLGGTNIKTGVMDPAGRVCSKLSVPTEAKHGPDDGIDRMCRAGRDAVEQAGLEMDRIRAIGIGSPGPLNHKQGTVSPANMPGWQDVPLRDRIGRHFDLPTTLENDGNVAAWGEFWVGAGRDADSLVMFTLGTGIGGGIVVGGSFIRGFFDNGAEVGHMIIDPRGRMCNCGQRGCFEAHASAAHTANMATEAVQAGRRSSLKDVLDCGESITTERIVEHMQAGDELAREVWHDACKAIAIGTINLSHIINPELVVLFGGMVYAADLLLDPVNEYYKSLRSAIFADNYARIVPAELGNDAGFIGAAGAAKLRAERGELD